MTRNQLCPTCLRRIHRAHLRGSDQDLDLVTTTLDRAPENADVYVEALLPYVVEPYDPTDWIRPPHRVLVPHTCEAAR